MDEIIVIEETPNNGPIKACRVCLETGCRMYDANKTNLPSIYYEVTSIPWPLTEGIPQFLCYMCHAYLLKCAAFRNKCRIAHDLMKRRFLDEDVLSQTNINDLKDLLPAKSFIKKTLFNLQCPNVETSVEKICKEAKIKEEIEEITNPAPFNIDNDDKLSFNVVNDDSDEEKYKPDDDDLNDENDKPLSFLKKDLKTKNIKNELQNKTKKGTKKRLLPNRKTKKPNIKYKDEIKSGTYHTEHNYVKSNKQIEVSCPRSDDDDDDGISGMSDDSEAREIAADYDKYVKNQRLDLPKSQKAKQTGKRKQKYPRQREPKCRDDFAKQYGFEIKVMTPEEERQEIKNRKMKKNYQLSEYTCELCFRGFRRKSCYDEHLVRHDKSFGDHECDICFLRFKLRDKYKKHMLVHKVKFVCKQCGQVFRNSTAARTHYDTHKGVQFGCEHCGKQFNRYKSRVEHIRIFHGSTTCDICYRGFTNQSAVTSHKTLSHRITFPCKKCETIFDNEEALSMHTSSTAGDTCDSFRACCACGISFKDEEMLNEHIDMYHPLRPPKIGRGRRPGSNEKSCCPCKHRTVFSQNNSKFTNTSSPDNNIVANSGVASGDVANNSVASEVIANSNVANRDLANSTSGISYTDAKITADNTNYMITANQSSNDYSLATHSDNHINSSEINAYGVINSDAGANNSQIGPNNSQVGANNSQKRLNANFDCGCPCKKMKSVMVKKRDNLKRFMCEMCASDSFCSATALREHQLVHTGEKPHQCTICSKSFRIKYLLKAHMNVHLDARPYQCAECGKTFRTSTARNRHTLVHTGVRRHGCSACGKHFQTSSCLKAHVLHVHMKVPAKPRIRKRAKT